jgi:hypothetical protein
MSEQVASANAGPRSVEKTKGRQPRAKPARHIRLVVPLYGGEGPGVVRIAVEGQAPCDYLVRRLPSDFGTAAFSLAKVGGNEQYAVLIDGADSSCECKGFLRWSKCKHVDGLTALVARGLL